MVVSYLGWLACLVGWLVESRTALIVGGGDGVGKLHDIATKVSLFTQSGRQKARCTQQQAVQERESVLCEEDLHSAGKCH